jgi:ferritin-like metal-binding protein YciE
MTTARERLVEWLRDAYAAEQQAETMLRRTAGQIEGHAEFRAGLERHGAQSGEQAQQLERCLEQLGESPSLIKTVTGQITAFAQTLAGYVVGDEPVKAVLATATFAHMEVSSYRILIAAAQTTGEAEVARVCETLLGEETRFAEWLDGQLSPVTSTYLAEVAGSGRTAAEPGLVD